MPPQPAVFGDAPGTCGWKLWTAKGGPRVHVRQAKHFISFCLFKGRKKVFYTHTPSPAIAHDSGSKHLIMAFTFA